MDRDTSTSGRASGIEALAGLWSRRRWLALLAFAWGLSAALCVTASLPDVYTAAATVLVERDLVSESIVKPGFSGALDTRLRTISQELLSRARLRELIRRFDLYARLRASGVSEERLVERMRREIRLDVQAADLAQGGRETVAFTIGFRGTDPALVAEVANTLAAFYVDENMRSREEQTSRTASFLQDQLEEARRHADEQASRLHAFNAQHMGGLPQQVGANLATLERLNAQLELNLEQQLRAAERKERLMGSLGSDGSREPLPGADSPRERLTRLEAGLIELRSRYSAKHPDVLQAQAEIESLRKEIAAGKAPTSRRQASRDPEPPGALPGSLTALQRDEKRLRDAIERYQERIESAPQIDQELQEIMRDHQVAKEQYESLLARDEQARLAQSLEIGRLGEQFRVLDPAVAADTPAAPNRLRLLILGLLASLAGAAGVVALAERLDTSFHSIDSLRAFTRVPVLASIPKIGTRSDTLKRRFRMAAGAAALSLGMVLTTAALWYLSHDNDQLAALLSRGGS